MANPILTKKYHFCASHKYGNDHWSDEKNYEVFGKDYNTPDGTCIRDYIHVSDLADAHVLALEFLLQKQKNLTFNCGYGHGYSAGEVVQKPAGGHMVIHTAEWRGGDAGELVAGSSKTRKVLGWEPSHDDLKEVVKSTLEWERKSVHEQRAN